MVSRTLAPWLALLPLVIPMTAAADELRAQRFDADLAPTRTWTAPAGGEIVALATLPDGGVAAVARSAAGAIELVRWSAEGKETSRRAVALEGRADQARLRQDGAWVVLTDQEVAQVGPDGAVQRRRARGAELAPPVVAAAGEAGAWLAFPGRLVHLALDGADASVKLPLEPAPSEACKKEFDRPEDCRWSLAPAALLPLRDGGCLLAERLEFFHAASGPSRTEQVALHRLDGKGHVQARRLVGELRSSVEWFPGSGTAGKTIFLPGKPRVAQRAWSGGAMLFNLAERGSGELLVALRAEGDELWLLGRDLKTRWARQVQLATGQALPPPWSRGILAFAGRTWLEAFDERGAPRGDAEVRLEPGLTRSAIGQTPAGEWLLVSW